MGSDQPAVVLHYDVHVDVASHVRDIAGGISRVDPDEPRVCLGDERAASLLS